EVAGMLHDVGCADNGTANAAAVPGVSVAGKTGTAYKAQPDGTYFNAQGKHTYYTSFVGFFPTEDPQVTVLVSIDEPPTGTSGGQAAAPVFSQIGPTIMNEMSIQPPAGSTGCEGSRSRDEHRSADRRAGGSARRPPPERARAGNRRRRIGARAV